MKQFLLSSILSIFSTFLLAHSLDNRDSINSPNQRSLQVLYHVGTALDNEIYFNPGLGFKQNQHSFNAGFLGFWRFGDPNFHGWFAGYKYEPKFQFKRLTTFTFLQIQQVNGIDYDGPVSPSERGYMVELQSGYGLSIRLFQNLYFDQSFAASMRAYVRPNKYNDVMLILHARFGLHYEFNLKTKN